LTTLELLDAVEAGIAALRSQNGDAAGPQNGHVAGPQNGHVAGAQNGHAAETGGGAMAPAELRREMSRAALSTAQFANVAGVGRDEVEDWVEGREPIPSWVPAAVRVVALLTPSALRRLLNGPTQTPRPAGTHPFSRIEEL
jgi:hypothetical protein